MCTDPRTLLIPCCALLVFGGCAAPGVRSSGPSVDPQQVAGAVAAAVRVELAAAVQAVTTATATVEAAAVKVTKTQNQNFDPWTLRLLIGGGIAAPVVPYFTGRWLRLRWQRLRNGKER